MAKGKKEKKDDQKPVQEGFDAEKIRREIARIDATKRMFKDVKQEIENVADEDVRQRLFDKVRLVEEHLLNASEFKADEQPGVETKIAVYGSLGSGKSALISYFLSRKIDTIQWEGDGRIRKTIPVEGQTAKVTLLEAEAPTPQSVNWADAFVICFNVTDGETVEEVHGIYSKIHHYANGEFMPMILVGTHADDEEDDADGLELTGNRDVRVLEGLRLAMDLNRSCPYAEVSAVTGRNVDNIFKYLAGSILMLRDGDKKRLKGGLTQQWMASTKASLKRALEPNIDGANEAIRRPLPVMQGFLLKLGGEKSMVKDWRKKYVIVCPDGTLAYFPSVSDYVANEGMKVIQLAMASVKPITRRHGTYPPRKSQHTITAPPSVTAAPTQGSSDDAAAPESRQNGTTGHTRNLSPDHGRPSDTSTMLSGARESDLNSSIDGDSVLNAAAGATGAASGESATRGSGSKLGHSERNDGSRGRRDTVSKVVNGEASPYDQAAQEREACQFVVITLNGRRWHFQAATKEEAKDWIQAIERQILFCLKANISDKQRENIGASGLMHQAMQAGIRKIQSLPGNDVCADCNCADPDWAVINLGMLVCIECSGIHRQLGTHISKVRSLTLDHLPQGMISVLFAIGNGLGNSVWEANLPSDEDKPKSTDSREDKEAFIKRKYVEQEFLLPKPEMSLSIAEGIFECVKHDDLSSFIALLPHATEEDVNYHCPDNNGQTACHAACILDLPLFLQLLITNGARFDLVDEQNHSPLFYAQFFKNSACVDVLYDNGLRAPTAPKRSKRVQRDITEVTEEESTGNTLKGGDADILARAAAAAAAKADGGEAVSDEVPNANNGDDDKTVHKEIGDLSV
eukprot:Clim_evm99s88 gene=Clim_evmTU99s88